MTDVAKNPGFAQVKVVEETMIGSGRKQSPINSRRDKDTIGRTELSNKSCKLEEKAGPVLGEQWVFHTSDNFCNLVAVRLSMFQCYGYLCGYAKARGLARGLGLYQKR